MPIYVDVSGDKRGSGKSTVAVGIARVLADRGGKVELRGMSARETKRLKALLDEEPGTISTGVSIIVRDEPHVWVGQVQAAEKQPDSSTDAELVQQYGIAMGELRAILVRQLLLAEQEVRRDAGKL